MLTFCLLSKYKYIEQGKYLKILSNICNIGGEILARTFVGIGQCGSAILDAIFEEKNMFQIADPIVINSDVNDLKKLKNIGNQYWIGISKSEGFIEGTTKGFGEYVTGGFGNYPENAEKIIAPNYAKLKKVLKERIERGPSGGKGEEKRATPFALLAVGTGGGTGSGTAPFVAKALKELYDIPIIVAAVLPASGEGKEGKHLTWNAWQCIKKLSEHVDGFILVDNEKLSHKRSIEYHFPKYNKYIAKCITDLIAGIIIEKIDLSKLKFGREFKDIDFKDIVTTSSFQSNGENRPGFAVIGRASRQVRSLTFYMPVISKFSWGYSSIEFKEMLDEAKASLSLEIEDSDLKNARKNLVNIRVPDYYLKNEDALDTETIKNYMTQYSKTGWRILGISRTKRDIASITVLLTFLPNELQRLLEIEAMARDYAQEKIITYYPDFS